MRWKKTSTFFSFLFVVFTNAITVTAHCPLCSAAIGTGVAVAKFYGVDDAIVGIWVGAFIISTALWFDRILKTRFPAQTPIILMVAFISTVLPFFFAGIVDSVYDRIFFGLLIGSFLTYLGIFTSEQIKARRNETLFPFQTIVIVLLLLTLVSVCFGLFTPLEQYTTCG